MAGPTQRALCEVFTTEQACQVLGASQSRTVIDAARRREKQGGSPVYWDAADDSNPLPVHLFDAQWVRERASGGNGVAAEVPSMLVELMPRPGMRVVVRRVLVDPAPGESASDELLERLREAEQVIEGYRGEVWSEREARLGAQLAAKDADLAARDGRLEVRDLEVKELRAALAAKTEALGRMWTVVEALNATPAIA